jgi:hypothetical protein
LPQRQLQKDALLAPTFLPIDCLAVVMPNRRHFKFIYLFRQNLEKMSVSQLPSKFGARPFHQLAHLSTGKTLLSMYASRLNT